MFGNFLCCWQDDLLEKKEKGEFQPSGSNDVLSVALETPEHSGRVRGVGGFVSPKLFFNLPRQRIRVSKAQLSEELARQNKEIVELKAMISATNLGSPIISDKSSCHVEKIETKSTIAKELIVDLDDDDLDPHTPTTGKKVKIINSSYVGIH